MIDAEALAVDIAAYKIYKRLRLALERLSKAELLKAMERQRATLGLRRFPAKLAHRAPSAALADIIAKTAYEHVSGYSARGLV